MKRNKTISVESAQEFSSAMYLTLKKLNQLRDSLIAKPDLEPEIVVSEVDQIIQHCEVLLKFSNKVAEQSAKAERTLDKAESQAMWARFTVVINFVKTLLEL